MDLVEWNWIAVGGNASDDADVAALLLWEFEFAFENAFVFDNEANNNGGIIDWY